MTKSEQKEKLIELRHMLIGVLHTQPHTIYNNDTIEALLKAQPMSIEELTKVKGFPKDGKRVKCFGPAVVAIFNPEVKSKLEVQQKATEKSGVGSSTKETLKKISYFSVIASLAASGVLRSASAAQVSPNPLETPVAVVATTGSIATGSTIEEVEDTRKRDLAVFEFCEKTKKEAKVDWNEVCNQVTKEKLKQEEEKKIADERKVKKATEKIKKLRKQAIENTEKEVEEAKKDALRIAAEAKKEAEKLKRKAEEKAEKSGVNAQCLENYTSFKVGSEGRSFWKSWMPHKKADGSSIFCESSDQYALQQKAGTGKYGIRVVDGRYCIALGSAYTSKIGTKVDVVLQSGRILNCILGDQKADKDTDVGNRYHLSDGSYVEFVVDRTAIDYRAKRDGNFNSIEEFEGPVVEIRVAK